MKCLFSKQTFTYVEEKFLNDISVFVSEIIFHVFMMNEFE